MTSVAPPAEAAHPPEESGESRPPTVPDGRAGRILEPEINQVAPAASLLMPTPLVAIAFLVVAGLCIFLPAAASTATAVVGLIALFTLFIADASTLPKAKSLTAGRDLPAVFSLGHRHPIEIVVVTRRSRVRGRLVQTGTKAFEVLTRDADFEPPGGLPQQVSAAVGRDGVIAYEVRPRLRGRHRFPPIMLRLTGGLALATRRLTFTPVDEIHVYPDLDDVKRAEMALRRSRFLESGLRTKRFIGEGTEFESLREYHPDDDVRSINWHATAKHRRPITNQYRVERNQTVVTLIDCGRMMSTPVGSFSRLDIALANAAGVAYVCGKLEDRIGAVAFDDEIRANLAPRRGNVQTYLAALYDIEPSLRESDYELAFAQVAAGKRALVMVFTDLLDEGAARPLITALPSLVRRHQVLVASVRDPEIDHAMSLMPAEPREAFNQAAAVSVLERRTEVVRSISALGADVIEALPEEMTPALINSYLKLKARLRL